MPSAALTEAENRELYAGRDALDRARPSLDKLAFATSDLWKAPPGHPQREALQHKWRDAYYEAFHATQPGDWGQFQDFHYTRDEHSLLIQLVNRRGR